MLQGFHIITYALHIYYLNLFIAFLTPKVDPMSYDDLNDEDEDNKQTLPTHQSEFKPFIRRLPEFKVQFKKIPKKIEKKFQNSFKKISRKISKKISKTFQKHFKQISRKISKKISKTFQKNFKKISKKFQRNLKNNYFSK